MKILLCHICNFPIFLVLNFPSRSLPSYSLHTSSPWGEVLSKLNQLWLKRYYRVVGYNAWVISDVMYIALGAPFEFLNWELELDGSASGIVRLMNCCVC